VFFPLHLVQPFEFSTVVRGSKPNFGFLYLELFPLGFLDLRRLVAPCSVVTLLVILGSPYLNCVDYPKLVGAR
jgi:hypothetical protein